MAAAVVKTSDDEDSLATASDAGGGNTPRGTPNSSVVNLSQSTTPVMSLNKVVALHYNTYMGGCQSRREKEEDMFFPNLPWNLKYIYS